MDKWSGATWYKAVVNYEAKWKPPFGWNDPLPEERENASDNMLLSVIDHGFDRRLVTIMKREHLSERVLSALFVKILENKDRKLVRQFMELHANSPVVTQILEARFHDSIRDPGSHWSSTVQNLDTIVPLASADTLTMLMKFDIYLVRAHVHANPQAPAEVLLAVAKASLVSGKKSRARQNIHNIEYPNVVNVLKHPNFPVEHLISYANWAAEMVPEWVQKYVSPVLNARTDELTAWLQEEHPELVGLPWDWVMSSLPATQSPE